MGEVLMPGWPGARYGGSMLALASKVVERLYWSTVRGPRGFGRPFSREHWEQQYRAGAWDYLDSLPELPRFMVVAGYAMHDRSQPTILDIGCGTGRLLKLLSALGFSRYLGVDISEHAIAKCEALCIPRTTFEVANFDTWTPEDHSDVMIFNESLNYATNPSEVLQRYSEKLKPGGSMVISLFRYRNAATILRLIRRRFHVVACTRLRNEKGQRTDVSLIRPRPGTT